MSQSKTISEREQPNLPKPTRSTLRGHLDLLDPVTWVAGPQGFIGGVIGAGFGGKFDGQTFWLIFLGFLLTGPLTIGFSQSINDYFDRDVDAINEPTRPIPAGLVTLQGAILNVSIVALLAMVCAIVMALTGAQNGMVLVVMTFFGLILGTFYSMPPLEFKRNGISGPLSVGLGYNLFTWVMGMMTFGPFKWDVFCVALVNAFIAVGLIIMNDLKSIDGDRKLGLRTLPVMYGPQGALRVSFFFIDVSQAAFAVYLLATGHVWIGILQVVALAVQMLAQRPLYAKPTHQQYKIYLLSGNFFILAIAFLSAFSFGGYLPSGW